MVAGKGYTAIGGEIISQGTYCGGINVPGDKTLNLNSGLYILKGGGLTLSGGSNIIGTGVTFYNTGTAATYKKIDLSGGSTTNLSAPTSEPFEGILFFQDRSNTIGSTISGGSGMVIQGAHYFPTAHIDYSGGSSVAAYTIIVSKTLTLSGGSAITLNNDFSTLAGGSPIKSSALYE